ncbi:MAG TPA: hypothetical protein VLA97_10860 [Nocardioidaceae bacterium]|nr:hypothetical protein [Nocardioidaceae bacterium]
MSCRFAIPAAGVLTTMLMSGCTAESPARLDGPETDTGTAVEWPSVVCPEVRHDRRHQTAFRRKSPGGPRLDAEMTVHAVSRRNFCVDASLDEGTPAGRRITSYTVTPGDDAFNYGESYTTSDRRGSEELLNFPFEFHVYGPCRSVTGTIVVTDRAGREHSYVAATQAGPRCDR